MGGIVTGAQTARANVPYLCFVSPSQPQRTCVGNTVRPFSGYQSRIRCSELSEVLVLNTYGWTGQENILLQKKNVPKLHSDPVIIHPIRG